MRHLLTISIAPIGILLIAFNLGLVAASLFAAGSLAIITTIALLDHYEQESR